MAVCAKGDIRLPAGGMHLGETLGCGQSFAWRQQGEGWLGVAGGRAALVRQEGDALFIAQRGEAADAKDEAFWRHYFALDIDYAELQRRFAADERLAACVAASPGLRVLRQPFFETLLCFIISQNNHIARIAGICDRLRAGFGPALPGGEHGFPPPEALAGLAPEDLAGLRAGWRAGYLIDAAQKVALGEVDEAALRAAPSAEARQMLMKIRGVGPKVADCALLFGLSRWEAVPMDVWMKRALRTCFPGGLPPCARGCEGIAQQYVFHWARRNLPKGT